MRISDWSSDVCSSDLPYPAPRPRPLSAAHEQPVHLEELVAFEVGEPLRQADTAIAVPFEHVEQHAEARCALVERGQTHLEQDRGDIGERLLRALQHLEFETLCIDLERQGAPPRSEEHTSELQSLMRISYAVFCLKKKTA